ncbi:hypothetical protein LWI29_019749 [Acer saccharum]|uniref:Retrotransposon gag domain-containing protein n=1 Tax=Acer saccharum TaxID=4024 RepID=A0AA39RED4_ACESA|nr:hypothetical protein LWI29_019749 [Acer saccharum]
MKQYEGTTDPDNHIAQYKQRMFTAAIPRDLREACMCKAFGSSLSGPALQWYTNLPNNSIDSFAQLTDTFMEQFASSRKLEKLSNDLYTITQRTGENLRAYVGRFNREKVQIPHCNQATAIYAFRKGLRFDSDYTRNLPNTLAGQWKTYWPKHGPRSSGRKMRQTSLEKPTAVTMEVVETNESIESQTTDSRNRTR